MVSSPSRFGGKMRTENKITTMTMRRETDFLINLVLDIPFNAYPTGQIADQDTKENLSQKNNGVKIGI